MADPANPPTPGATAADVNQRAEAFSTWNDIIKILTESYNRLSTTLSTNADIIAATIPAYVSLASAQGVMNTELYKMLVGNAEKAAMVPRQLASEIIGSNILLSDHMNVTSDTMTKNALRMQETAYKDQEALTTRVIKLGKDVQGQDITLPLASYFKNAADLGKAFYEGAMVDTRLYSAAMNAMTTMGNEEFTRMKTNSSMAMKALDLDVTTITALYQQELSKTGKISGETVDKFSATIIAAAKETGIGTKQLSADMQKMVTDVEHFGNITEFQMASLSASIHKLGLDMNDVLQVTQKFSTFEGASSAIANIGAVTGATMDTMELFYLANEDKEEFFKRLRQNLLDQGVSLENLSHQEQVYLSKQVGFSNVRQLQTLLNEDIDFTSENLSSKIEEAASSQELMGDKLTEQLAQLGGLAKETMDALEPGAQAAVLETIRNLAGGTSGLADQTIRLRGEMSKLTVDAMPAMAASGQAMQSGFVTAVQGAMNAMAGLAEYLKNYFAPGGAFDDALKRSVPHSWPKIWEGFGAGIDYVRAETSSTMKGMKEDVKVNFQKISDELPQALTKSYETATERFKKLREEHAARAKELEELEKDLAKNMQARLTETTSLESEYKTLSLSYSADARKAKLQERFGGAGKALSDADVDAIVAAFDTGDAAAISKIISGDMDKKLEDAKAKAEAPAAPAAAGAAAPAPAAPAAASPATPAAPRPAAGAGSTEASGEIALKVKLELDVDQLADMIKTHILPDALSGGITLRTPVGSLSQGTYRLVPEVAA